MWSAGLFPKKQKKNNPRLGGRGAVVCTTKADGACEVPVSAEKWTAGRMRCAYAVLEERRGYACSDDMPSEGCSASAVHIYNRRVGRTPACFTKQVQGGGMENPDL